MRIVSLKLMYITNNPPIAQIAEDAGVDRIFIDMEFIGKDKRQGGLDTAQNHHTIEDIRNVRRAIKKAELLVRINPMHEHYEGYMDSKEEIDAAIEAGADILMLPYFATPEEVEQFITYVDGRVKTLPLVENAKAVERLEEVLTIPGIDQIHIGLNDLSLDMRRKFLFEILADGTVDQICEAIKRHNIPFGFGGFGRIGHGRLPAEMIIKEHYRLGSSCGILSRSFCNISKIADMDRIQKIFREGVKAIRDYEETCVDGFEENHRALAKIVEDIIR